MWPNWPPKLRKYVALPGHYFIDKYKHGMYSAGCEYMKDLPVNYLGIGVATGGSLRTCPPNQTSMIGIKHRLSMELLPARPKLSQTNFTKLLFWHNGFCIHYNKISLYKAHSFVCSLANRDKQVAATLQRKCSGGFICNNYKHFY